MIPLTPRQEWELRRYAEGKPRRPAARPNSNLIRRGLIENVRHGGWYAITPLGLAALKERLPAVGTVWQEPLGSRQFVVVSVDEGFVNMLPVGCSRRSMARAIERRRGGYLVSVRELREEWKPVKA